MYIYNITINIDESIHDQWLDWMQNKHIKDVLSTKKFTSARLVKVLVDEEMGGITYSVQYFAPSKQHLNEYHLQHADLLRQEGLKLFADKMLTFQTELEIISEH